jgi:hypothetical protein
MVSVPPAFKQACELTRRHWIAGLGAPMFARSTGTARAGDMHGARVLERGDKEQQAAPILAQRFLSIRNFVTSMYRE